jgi:sigma-B regulation protein RsbU (phosphoserine phosphatase)
MPTIIIQRPSGEETTVELSESPIRFGRAEDCDYVLRQDAEISRFHAEIWLDEKGRIVVADKGSKNGTRVDERDAFRDDTRIAQNTVKIGEHVIRILPQPGAAPVAFAADDATQMRDTQFFPSSRGLDLNQQRLQLLIELTERIGGVFDRKQLLEQALDACCSALGFERGLIVLRTERGDTELPISRNMPRDETGAFKVSRTLINRALVQGERAVVNNPATDFEGNLTESLIRFPICSALCVPILNRDEILGCVYGDRITQGATYTPADVDFLAAIAKHVGVGLANLRLFRTHAQTQAVQAELQRARKIQKNLLPAQRFESAGIMFQGYNEPSSEVSGDYFDYFPIDDDRAGFIIADVTGHGLPAALVMANLQSAVRVALTGVSDLRELAKRVNKVICRNTSSSVFVTAILGTVNARTGVAEYVNAGHPAPISVGQSGARLCEDDNSSLPLGIDPDETFRLSRLEPTPGHNAFVFYTDGFNEAMNHAGDLLGIAPIIERIAQLETTTTDNLIRCVREVVRDYLDGQPAGDDMTLLAITFDHHAAASADRAPRE